MYVTQADLIARFGEQELIELTDRADPPAGVIDQTVLDMAIDDANAEIDTYIQGRYTLPLASVPKPLKRKAADLARYFLYDDHPTDQVIKAYEDAIAFLKGVAAGRISLGPASDGTQAVSTDGAEMIAPDRVFDRADKSFI